jgi:hypothetical protein
MKVSLKLSSGKPIVKDFDKSSVTIGRSTKADFVIIDEALSRLHAQIDDDNGDFYITDLASSNGVTIDGNRLPPNQKTKVNSFQQISIGAYECQLEYTDRGNIQSPQINKQTLKLTKAEKERSESPTFQNRNINPNALKGPAIVSPKNKSKKLGLKFNPGLLFLPVLIAIGIYYSEQKSQNGIDDTTSLPPGQELLANVPEPLRNVADQFKDDYTQHHGGSNCTFQTACTSMKLNTSEGEGAFLEGNEVFIYVYPEIHTDPILEKAKGKPFSDEAVSLYLLLSSEVMNDFMAKKFAQIHLIVIDRMVHPKKVYRLHAKYFASSEHLRLLAEMVPAFEEGGNLDAFWKQAAPLIKTKQY